jgi:hypothetical protein
MKEATNNFEKSVFHLIKYGCIEIACIFCQETYNINNKNLLYHRDNTLFCYKCGIDTMISITKDSILFDLNEEERKEQIKEWHIEGFEPLIQEEDYYCDYEYDENYEEIKEEPSF